MEWVEWVEWVEWECNSAPNPNTLKKKIKKNRSPQKFISEGFFLEEIKIRFQSKFIANYKTTHNMSIH